MHICVKYTIRVATSQGSQGSQGNRSGQGKVREFKV